VIWKCYSEIMQSIEALRLKKAFELTEMLIRLNIAADATAHPDRSSTELNRRFQRRMRIMKDRR
jgi:hypothetical protein